MKKKVLIILACLWIIISFLIIRATYAKYLSTLGSNADIGIATWKILLNTQDIINNSNFSNNLSLEFPGDTYYAEDCLVPGGVGYFDLVIDSSNTPVAFSFVVDVTPAQNSDIADTKAIGYQFIGQQNYITYLNSNVTTVQGSANASINSTTIRVYVSWDDDPSTQTLTDAQDTAIALSEGEAIINVSVSFSQLIS